MLLQENDQWYKYALNQGFFFNSLSLLKFIR